jgi:SAM-dependent methyltransferase
MIRSGIRALDAVPFLREVTLPFLFVVFWIFLNRWLDLAPHEGGEILGAFIAAVVGYYVTYRIRMRGFFRSVKIVREIADSATLSAGRTLYVEMIHDRMSLARKIVRGFQSDTYEARSPEEFQGWIDTFFRLGGGNYVAVDSHLPSRYWSDYGWFLEAHARFLQERRDSGENPLDVRVLSVSAPNLDDDFFGEATSADYKRFVEWHRENGVELRVIRPESLARIREQYGLLTEDDIGLWVKFAALFTPADQRGDGGVKIKLRVRDDVDSFPTYVILSGVMAAIREASSPIDAAPPGVEMGDPALIARWNDYLGPDLRWSDGGAYERFLTKHLPPDGDILDAAAGTGVDSVNLLVRNYSVISNEVDPRLRRAARDFANKRSVNIELRGQRWEELTLAGNPRFNAVLVLGNSLCLVPAKARRLRALNAFYRVLRPGGTLLIDERNFEFMRLHAAEIVNDPYRHWLMNRHDVMYPSRSVLGFPRAIDGTSVTWAFCDNAPQVTTGEDMLERAARYEGLILSAFSHGELFSDLRACGFEVVGLYGDLEPIYQDPAGIEMPSYGAVANCDFLSYVAIRPLDGTE